MQQLLADKREREKRVVAQMIQLYCSKQHHNGATLCKECSCLLSYANERIDHCPFIKEKTFCSNCQVHCYQPQMREQIRQVMRSHPGECQTIIYLPEGGSFRTKDAAASSGVGSAPSA